MACAQMDFYEASQLHLFHFASIKLAEATMLHYIWTPGRANATWRMVTQRVQLPLPNEKRNKIWIMQLCFWNMQIYGRHTNMGMKKRKKRKTKKPKHVLLTLTYTHLHSKLVTAGGISVRGASLNFCRVNSFQMQEFTAGSTQSRCPVCQRIRLKLCTFEQSFSSHLPEGGNFY